MVELLEYALALEAERNFARAARRLGISQPTLTRGIQELERHFGARLFDRTGRGIFPTGAGQILLDRARRITGSLVDLKKEISSYEGLEHAELRLGIGPVVAQTWVPDAIASLMKKHPRVEVHVETRDFWELVPHLLNQTIELAIGEVIPDIQRHSEISVTPLPPRPVRFFCRIGHPLTQIDRPTMADIGVYAMAGPKLPVRASEDFGGTRTLGRLSARGTHFEPQISCQTFDVCLRIIRASDNIGIAPASQLARIPANAGIAIIPFDAACLRTNQGLMRLRERTLSPSAVAFVESCLSAEQHYHAVQMPLESKPKSKGKRAAAGLS